MELCEGGDLLQFLKASLVYRTCSQKPAKGATNRMLFPYHSLKCCRFFLKEHGRMTEWEAAHTAEAILHLLCESHRQGILYADLKPNNILLKRRYRRMHSFQQSLQLRIADFGCSQKLQACTLWLAQCYHCSTL